MSVEPQADDDAAGAESGGEHPDEQPLPPIPDALLAPLLDSAGEALRRLPPADLPAAARRLRSFDRRGLATPAARHQLRTLLEEEEVILSAAAALFRARPEAARLAEAWTEAMTAGGDAPVDLVSEVAAEGRLPLLASVLVSGLPDCFEFGLGLVVAMAATSERESEAAGAVRAATTGQQAAEEAARRADAARSTAEAEAARLDAALREERRARRERDQQAAAAAASETRQAELEAALAEAQQRVADTQRRMAGAEKKAADAEHRAAHATAQAADAAARAATAEQRALTAERRAAAGEPAPSSPGDDRLVLDEIARAAEDLAAGLRRLADDGTPPPQPGRGAEPRRRRAPSPSRGTPSPSRPTRRAPVQLPPGMVQDDPAAVAAMVRTPGVAVIVDGYNVSMLAWPDVSAAEQRQRLCDALAEFQLRIRRDVTVVFDGADVTDVRPGRRRNLRVVFSAAGQEADAVVVDEVMFRPAEVPVIVVSSDREVRAAAEAEGATVLGADKLLQLMRR